MFWFNIHTLHRLYFWTFLLKLSKLKNQNDIEISLS